MKRTKAMLAVGVLMVVGLALPASASAAVAAKPAVQTVHPTAGHMDTKCSAMTGLL